MCNYTMMFPVPLFCFYVTAVLAEPSSLRILDKRRDCSQQNLRNCKINNCSEKSLVVQRRLAPTVPDLDPERVGVWMDERGLISVMNVTWKLKGDASILKLRGSVIYILHESTNRSICLQFTYNLSRLYSFRDKVWEFPLDGVVVEPRHTYTVSVFNLPVPDIGDYRTRRRISIPGCDDRRIQGSQVCLQNGSLWDPHMTADVSVDKEHKKLYVVIGFETGEYSERYQVSLQNQGFYHSKNVSKDNKTLLNVTFVLELWQLSQCKISLVIQPFFIRCKNDCWCPKRMIDYCLYHPPRTSIVKLAVGLLIISSYLAYLLWRLSRKGWPSEKCKSWTHTQTFLSDRESTSSPTTREQPEGFQVKERKRVLIIYSLDHPLYKNIVLKLCTFLVTTCGTEVVLDLLDSTRLGVLGSIQWLDWHREQIGRSSDKILILCSRGVQAKWRAMCGDKKVSLREDAHSPVGDMLSPALSLMVPHFIQSASFEKYIVAYFNNICSEEDVPSPFKVTVRYKLMKQFEELFFRILDTEMYRPGWVNHIEGFSEEEYHHWPSGRALRDAIEAFHAYQLEHPQWFEEELVQTSDLS